MTPAKTVNLDEQVRRLLLRFFRTGDEVKLSSGSFKLSDDLEYLRIQWSLSNQVEALARYLLENRHEAQASLGTELVEGSGVVRGRLDPVLTLRAQRLTGDASRVCYHEPRRSFSDGPNHVLAWVLQYSAHLLRRYRDLLRGSTEYQERVARILGHLDSIIHLKGIGESISKTPIHPRPSTSSVIQAGRSRKRLYRAAFTAYQILQRVEAGDGQHTVSLLNESLIGPLEDWQKFELLLALKLSETMAQRTGHELVLLPIEPGSARPIAQFGPYDVYWQSRSPLQEFPEPEPSEIVVNEILRSYGIRVGSDRPDVVICDREQNVVVALGEGKFSTNASSWNDAFREAVTQLVRYSRLYTGCVPQDVLLRRSIVAVSNLPEEVGALVPDTAPVAVNMTNLLEGDLRDWPNRVASPRAATTITL